MSVSVFDPERTHLLAYAMHRRQVAVAAFGRKAVQHGADELHQCRLAGLVLAVEYDERLGQPGKFKVCPDSKAIDVELFEFSTLAVPPR